MTDRRRVWLVVAVALAVIVAWWGWNWWEAQRERDLRVACYRLSADPGWWAECDRLYPR